VDLFRKCLTEFVAWAALISVARLPLANITAGTVAGVRRMIRRSVNGRS
jgi:hypothetical protein